MKKGFGRFLYFACMLAALNSVAGEYSPEIETRIHSLQKQMRQALSAGRNDDARNLLEQGANNFHAIELELGIIQTLMQTGEYRHALSAAAHTQAEHPDNTDAALLYAWLLAIGGQTQPALQLLEATLARHPHYDALAKLRQQIKSRQLIAAEIPTSDSIQLRPFTPERAGDSTRQIGAGVVISDGKRVITRLAYVRSGKRLVVRNGLGRESNASLEKSLPGNELAVLVLEQPYSNLVKTALADKTPFPGTPIYIVGFSPRSDDQSDWPQLKVDILGMPGAKTPNDYPVHISDSFAGAGVFDQRGNLIGIINSGSNSSMTPLAPFFADFEVRAGGPAKPANPLAKLPMDEVYEHAFGNLVQILNLD